MTPFAFSLRMMDLMRRHAGRFADSLGEGPEESSWQEVARFAGARLRFYGGDGPPVLIVPAPFKRAYIWDIMPAVSPVRAALDTGLRVYMLEWLPPVTQDPDRGLADYALGLPEAAVHEIVRYAGAPRVSLIGHSLGGTFAGVFAALRPDRVARLALIDAPLAFGPEGGPLAQAVRRAPHAHVIAWAFSGPVPGAAINTMSASAAPDAFVLQRWLDLLASFPDARTRALHRRVMRWSLDEFPLPQRLFVEIAEDLYRHDRFRAGTLSLRGEKARLSALRAPLVAVINPGGRVVPAQSILAGLSAAACGDPVLTYRPEPGPALQHLGPCWGSRRIGSSGHKSHMAVCLKASQQSSASQARRRNLPPISPPHSLRHRISAQPRSAPDAKALVAGSAQRGVASGSVVRLQDRLEEQQTIYRLSTAGTVKSAVLDPISRICVGKCREQD